MRGVIAAVTGVLVAVTGGCGGESSGGSAPAAQAAIVEPANGCLNAASVNASFGGGRPLSAGGWLDEAQAAAGSMRLIATPRADAAAADVESALGAVNPLETRRTSRAFVLEVACASSRAALEATGLFDTVEEDQRATTAMLPNDPAFPSQWHLARIGAAGAWDLAEGSPSVTVAIIDSGCAPHGDLVASLVEGWNFLTETTDTNDTMGHGTSVAGCIAAAMNNGIAGAGVAPGVRIMPLVVLDAQGQAWYSDIAQAIRYAADRGVQIINVSMGGSGQTSDLNSAVQYAWERGSLVFASAMNGGDTRPQYPAAAPHAIAVSATTPADTRAAFSNYGDWIDLSAPGQGILTPAGTNAMVSVSGTSFASPIAAGVAALAISARPTIGRDALVALLLQTAQDLGPAGYDPSYGWGLVNAQSAVAAAMEGALDATAPAVFIASPACDLLVQGGVSIQGEAVDASGIGLVVFSVDGAFHSESTQGAFSFSWQSTPGVHTLTVTAYDAAGNVGVAWTRTTSP